MNQLTKRENRTAISGDLTAQKPSLPACALPRMQSLGGTAAAPTLPKDLIPNGRDQVLIRQAISNFRTALSVPVPAHSAKAVDAMGEVLDGMFKGWPMYGAGSAQVAALTVRYLKALRDVPTWAVQAAVDRWGEGNWKLEFGESFDKIPSSATLRRMAETEVRNAESFLRLLERIDAATAEIPQVPQSAEDRERMAAKFKALSEELGQRMAARAAEGRSWPLKERFDAEYESRRQKAAVATAAETAMERADD